MTKLIHSQAGRIIGEYQLEQGVLSIGRAIDSDICVDDITVSSRHALIEVVPSAYLEGLNETYIVDQKSTNGTVIDGKKVKRHLFKNGEVAKIGQHEFRLVDEEALGFEQTRIFIPDDD